MTTPPLLMIAEGRRPRPRKAPTSRPMEIDLHMRVAALLRRRCRSDWQWTHIASGELRDKRTAVKLKRMGLRPGWPDFVLVSPRGQMHCLELKRAGESLSDDQENFKFWSIRHGVPFVVAYAIDDILAASVAWRCLRDDALVAGGSP
jgi:hypothetical protein